MAIRFKSSADKHGIPRGDAIYAMTHHVAKEEQAPRYPGETVFLYIGHPHAQTDSYIEVIAAITPPDDILIFHVMPKRSLYDYLLEGTDHE